MQTESFKERLEAMASASLSEKPRRDVRSEVATAIKSAGTSQTKVAAAIGTQAQNLHNYIQGRRALPYCQVERVLWLLDGTKEREVL